jgi:hypothetical protein
MDYNVGSRMQVKSTAAIDLHSTTHEGPECLLSRFTQLRLATFWATCSKSFWSSCSILASSLHSFER